MTRLGIAIALLLVGLVDDSGGGCGVGMALEPTEWGRLLRSHL